MGFFRWVHENFFMSEEEKRREKWRQMEAYSYQTKMRDHWAEYRPQLEEARKRYAETLKELYRIGGTTALGLTEDAFTKEEKMEMMYEEIEEQAQKAQEMIKNISEELANDIEAYRKDKADAIKEYSNPE